MKKIFLLIAVATAIIFSSCSKNENNGSYEWPKYDKLLKTVSSDDGLNDEFLYDDQHRITKVVSNGELGNANYTYDDNLITIRQGSRNVKFSLDNNGYVIKEENGGKDASAQHEYSNGYISKTTWSDSDWVIYTWENGNLFKIAWFGETSSSYTYNTVPNKLSVNIFDMDYGLTEYMIFDDGDTFTNFKGSFTKNYPVSKTDRNGRIYTFEYTYDSDNYPTKIIVTENDPENGINITTYTLTYY